MRQHSKELLLSKKYWYGAGNEAGYIKMKHSILSVILLLSVITSCSSCEKDSNVPGKAEAEINQDSLVNNSPNQMEIKIGSSTFTATLYDNATAAAFKALLPMTISMADLNGNEKYFDLANSLPVKSGNPGTIQNGDLMVYGSKTLVLFYKSFDTSYSYTKLGRINDPAGLAAALGNGSVSVAFKL